MSAADPGLTRGKVIIATESCGFRAIRVRERLLASLEEAPSTSDDAEPTTQEHASEETAASYRPAILVWAIFVRPAATLRASTALHTHDGIWKLNCARPAILL